MISSLIALYSLVRLPRSVSTRAFSRSSRIFGLSKPHSGSCCRKNVPMKLSGSPKSPVQPSRYICALPDSTADR